MKCRGVINVKCWDGREMQIDNISIFIEKDPQDEKFYKVEGSFNSEAFMVAYSYVKETAMKIYLEALERLLTGQEQEKKAC